jgi:hypothetical protein
LEEGASDDQGPHQRIKREEWIDDIGIREVARHITNIGKPL